MNKLQRLKTELEESHHGNPAVDSINAVVRGLIDEVQELRDYICRRDNLPAWPVATPPPGGWPQDTVAPNDGAEARAPKSTNNPKG